MLRLYKSFFVPLILAMFAPFYPCVLLAQPGYIYASGDTYLSTAEPFAFKIQISTGNIVQFWKNSCPSDPCGAVGIAVVGNLMYYTKVNDNAVHVFDLKNSADLGVAFNVSQTTAISGLAYDGMNLWIRDGTATSNTFNVYHYTSTGKWISTVKLASGYCASLEYFVQNGAGRLLSCQSTYSPGVSTWDLYNTTGGSPIQTNFILDTPNYFMSGLAWDGTYFYTVNLPTPGQPFVLQWWSSSGGSSPLGAKKINGWTYSVITDASGVSAWHPDAGGPGPCEAASSPSVLNSQTGATAYMPVGNWRVQITGINVRKVEPTPGPLININTSQVVNSCASNPVTLQTVCTANDNTVYVLSGTTITNTLKSDGTGMIGFSGGSCTNCGVTMDAVHNQALIALSDNGKGAFQFLNLDTLKFGTISDSPAGSCCGFTSVSEGILLDPVRHLILSPIEQDDYELAQLVSSSSFFNPITFSQHDVSFANAQLDSAAEDCSTGIALASNENSPPVTVFLADLSQAFVILPSWYAPSQFFTLTQADLPNTEYGGIAVAQGTHTGIMQTEFSSEALVAFTLPPKSGTGIPALQDWVTCSVGNGFGSGVDPHDVTAYMAPDGSGHAIGLMQQSDRLARVDLTKMLDTTIVPRTPPVGGHLCKNGTLPSSVVTFIPF